MAEVSKLPGIVHRFPPTKLMETQYCSIVPDKFQRHGSVKELASTLAERGEKTKSKLFMMSAFLECKDKRGYSDGI